MFLFLTFIFGLIPLDVWKEFIQSELNLLNYQNISYKNKINKMFGTL